MIYLWVLVAAFEFQTAGAREAAMVAAGAGGWTASFTHNPALVLSAAKVSLAGGYCRPFGLDGVEHASASVATQWKSWAVAGGVGSLGFDRYRESQGMLCGGLRPTRAAALGVGVRWLVVDQGNEGVDMVPALDLGATWQLGRFVLSAAGRSVNRPGLGRSGVVQPALTLAAGAAPVEELTLLADLVLESDGVAGAFGCEFLLLPQLAIRAGLGTDPLRYGGGIGLLVGPVGLDYAYRFHPQLKETHQLGLTAKWH